MSHLCLLTGVEKTTFSMWQTITIIILLGAVVLSKRRYKRIHDEILDEEFKKAQRWNKDNWK